MKDIYTLFRHSLAGLRVLLALTLLLGLAYPLAITGIAQVAFP
jgi:K+-transporting ATPase ATPase C chain